MRPGKYDPAVWVVLGLLGVSVISVLMVFATRSCVQNIQEGFKYIATESTLQEERFWASNATELEPGEYAAFAEKARSIDLGIGVHLGMDIKQVESLLGAADSAARVMGGEYEHTYLFFADATGAGPKDRHKGGLFTVFNSASVVLTETGGKVTGITFYASPMNGGDEVRWPFLTLNGKPIVRCKKDDLAAILGEPSKTTKWVATWRFVPAGSAEEAPMPAEIDSRSPAGGVTEGEPPAESSAADAADTLEASQIPPPPVGAPDPSGGILVEAMIDSDTGFLYSLEIRER